MIPFDEFTLFIFIVPSGKTIKAGLLNKGGERTFLFEIISPKGEPINFSGMPNFPTSSGFKM